MHYLCEPVRGYSQLRAKELKKSVGLHCISSWSSVVCLAEVKFAGVWLNEPKL